MADDPTTAAIKSIAAAIATKSSPTGATGPAGPTGPTGPAGPTNITALTSDVTASGSGSVAATIAAGAVTLSKMANLAAYSIVGNNTGSSTTPLALTADQARLLLARTASFGGMYETNESGTAIVVASGGSPSGTFVGWVTSVVGNVDANSNVTFSANGTANRLVVGANGAGTYLIHYYACVDAVSGREIQTAVYLNNSRQDKIRCDVTGAGTSNDTDVVAFGLIALVANDFVDLRFSSDTNSTTITLKHANFDLVRIA